jgi:predicted ATPase
MITKISIKGFFSFDQNSEEIILNSRHNILIGINGTGKSNFIKAIRLLYEGIAGQGLEKILNKWGGFSGIANFSQPNIETITITYEFNKDVITSILEGRGHRFSQNPVYEIKIHKLGNSAYYLSEHIYQKNENNPIPFTYLNVTNGRGMISTKKGTRTSSSSLEEEFRNESIGETEAVFKEQELVLSQISEPKNYFPLYTLKKAIEELVVYNYFDTTFESVIRQLSPFYSDLKLLSNGENLTHLLNYLNGNHTIAYDKIIDLLRNTINSNFRDLVFSQPTSGKTLLALKEHNLNRAVPIEHISDGTLRFLLLLAIFYNPKRGKLICIDEPEIGLHPDMIRTIAEGIKYASQNGTQIIVATHSPLLLNAFDLEDLRIFEKDANNSTIISTKSEEDFENWQGEFLAGQMWLNGQLGGVRW